MKGVEELTDVSNALGVLFRSNKICRKKDPNTLTNGFVYWVGAPSDRAGSSPTEPITPKAAAKPAEKQIKDPVQLGPAEPLIKLTREDVFTLEVNGIKFEKMRKISEWENFFKLESLTSTAIVLDARSKFTRIFEGTIFEDGPEDGFVIVTCSTDIKMALSHLDANV